MGQGFKEVASLRGDDKKFQENFSKIDWSSTLKQKYECKDCKNITEYDLLIAGRCKDCHRSCPENCGGCSCHLSPPCTHCVDHLNEEDY